jgi:hypothetical protein
MAVLNLKGQSFSDYEQYQRASETIETYKDPKHKDFCMYYHRVFNVTSYRTLDIPVELLFTYQDVVIKTEGGPEFSMHSNYYKLYIPQDSMMFIVQSDDNRHTLLNSHLRLFLKVLEEVRERRIKP